MRLKLQTYTEVHLQLSLPVPEMIGGLKDTHITSGAFSSHPVGEHT